MKKEQRDDAIRDVLDDIIELTDNEGTVVPFELLDVVDLEGREFAVLFPCDEPDSEEVLVVGIEDDPTDPASELYVPVEDEALMNRVFEKFKELNRDVYHFLD